MPSRDGAHPRGEWGMPGAPTTAACRRHRPPLRLPHSPSDGGSRAMAHLRLQDRDLEILTALAEVGVLDLPTVAARFFPRDRTRRATQRRLHLYAAHGL